MTTIFKITWVLWSGADVVAPMSNIDWVFRSLVASLSQGSKRLWCQIHPVVVESTETASHFIDIIFMNIDRVIMTVNPLMSCVSKKSPRATWKRPRHNVLSVFAIMR